MGSNTTATTGYRFALSGPPASAGPGKSIVSIRLEHDGKPVTGAIIIQSRADMGPIGMAGMTAPIKSLGEQPPGIYRFEVENGSVWKKPDNWALSFSAKVQGVAQSVNGSVTVKLSP
ncbi:MAG: FixH family protein [Proteobacteria bacterium]|nr:FixH family protein [Pseudomonadota bacterium]